MRFNELSALLAICSLGSITAVTSVAVPDGHSGFRLEKRQNDVTPESEVEPADTRKLPAFYIEQDEVKWHQINESKSKLEFTFITKRGEKGIKIPAISDEARKKAHGAVNGDASENCRKVAEKITVLNNLLGIAERINLGKEAVFKKVIDGKTDTDLDSSWDNYLKAFKGYLDGFKSKVEATVDSTGKAFKDITGEDVVATYFSTAQLDKKEGAEEGTEASVQAKPECTDGFTHSTNDLTPIIDELKQKGNGPNNDNCCAGDMGTCQQLGYNGEIALNMCGPGEGPAQCTGCKNVADALTIFLDECKKDGRVGGKVALIDLEGVTLELGIIRQVEVGRLERLRMLVRP
ncbi:MAG: hypothetical protein Q9184_006172 [Pyrenodesmia sp. 2 TL-2023]